MLKHGLADLAESEKNRAASCSATSTGSTGEAFGAGNESAPLPGSKVEWETVPPTLPLSKVTSAAPGHRPRAPPQP
jgi:hypothetical protein